MKQSILLLIELLLQSTVFLYLWVLEPAVPVCQVTSVCLTLWDPMDCDLPGSSVHGIFQARILEWVAIPFFRGSSQPMVPTRVS